MSIRLSRLSLLDLEQGLLELERTNTNLGYDVVADSLKMLRADLRLLLDENAHTAWYTLEAEHAKP